MRKRQNRRRLQLAPSPTAPSDAARLPPPPAKGMAMISLEPEKEQRRAVEALAQALYEAEDPGGIAWVKRSLIVREPWLTRARRQLQTPT
jgi:hypothetical protein